MKTVTLEGTNGRLLDLDSEPVADLLRYELRFRLAEDFGDEGEGEFEVAEHLPQDDLVGLLETEDGGLRLRILRSKVSDLRLLTEEGVIRYRVRGVTLLEHQHDALWAAP